MGKRYQAVLAMRRRVEMALKMSGGGLVHPANREMLWPKVQNRRYSWSNDSISLFRAEPV